MAQTVLVDGFLHGGLALGGSQQGRHRLLQVRGEAGVHLGLDVDRPVHAVGDHADGVVLLDDAHAHFQKFGSQRLHVGGDAAANGHVAMGGGSGDHQRASLDLIGNDRIGRAVEMLLTADADHIRAGALDLRAHGVEEVGQVNDMGLLGCVVDGGVALGLDCRHHHVDGAAHGHHIKEHVAADKLVRPGNDAAAHGIHLSAQGFKALDVLVDGAGADGTSAGKVNLRFTTAAQQRAQEIITGTQAHGILIGHLPALGGPGIDGHMGIGDILHLCAQGAQDVYQRVNVGNIRQIFDGAGCIAKERGGDDGNCRVFAAADAHFTLQTITAGDQHSFFGWHDIRLDAGSPPALRVLRENAATQISRDRYTEIAYYNMFTTNAQEAAKKPKQQQGK